MAAVKKADLLFCYIDSQDCFGTLVEVGFAIAHNVPVVIAFAPDVASPVDNEFWFACVTARWVIYNVNACELPEYLKHALRRYA
jgi:nucleoside 2-deoxyribosyltransferase